MTFFHFINCVALAYAPFFITFKYSGLNEYSSLWRCLHASLGYLLTQLVKLLLLATFFPDSGHDEFSPTYEFFRSSADIVDVIGLHIIMTNFLNGKGEVRFITGGLGWGAAHSVANRLILLWVGARASAFSWKWIQISLDSTSDLLLFVGMAALTWMATRAANRFSVHAFLTFAVFHSFVYQSMVSLLGIKSWSLVGARFLYSAFIAGGALLSYTNWGTQSVKRD